MFRAGKQRGSVQLYEQTNKDNARQLVEACSKSIKNRRLPLILSDNRESAYGSWLKVRVPNETKPRSVYPRREE